MKDQELNEALLDAIKKRDEFKQKQIHSSPKDEDIVFYLADMFTLIFDDTIVKWCVFKEYGDKSPTFKDVLDKAKENGHTNSEIKLIAESPLQGYIYRYGAYLDQMWEYYGETKGYA